MKLFDAGKFMEAKKMNEICDKNHTMEKLWYCQVCDRLYKKLDKDTYEEVLLPKKRCVIGEI